MDMERKKNFLVNAAYYLLIALLAYLGLHYLLPMLMPFIAGFFLAFLVVLITRKLRCPNRWLRLLLALLIYGILGTAAGLLAAWCIGAVSDVVAWLPRLYALKLKPALALLDQWFAATLSAMDPDLAAALTAVTDALGETLGRLVSLISGFAVDLVSGAATGVPSIVLSILAMIFSTVFSVMDYDRIRDFAGEHLPEKWKQAGGHIRDYLTGTLFVVLRAYLMIMALTFLELSILFALFGIEQPLVKALFIAVLDILPLLGTGAVMIPWAVISLVLGSTRLGVELLIIYGIVTVVRNYVEPRIVGTQLGLHPIITLVSMFVGLRLIGFWGLFGFPVAISYFWKRFREKKGAA